jgi:hypothetical protein
MLGEVSFKPKLIEFHSTSTYSFNRKIETAFQELPQFLNSEITTLGYPRAGLFGFCVALISIEIVSKVPVRHAHLLTTRRYLGKNTGLAAMRWIENPYADETELGHFAYALPQLS